MVAAVVPQTPQQDGPPSWMKDMLGLMMMQGVARGGFGTPFDGVPSIPTPTPFTPTPSLKRCQEEPVDVPDLDVWLASLDAHAIRGKNNINYVQYLTKFGEHGLIDLQDLEGLSAEKLQELCGMPFGTANRLVKFVAEDLNIKRPRLA